MTKAIEIEALIPSISKNANYWLMRTEGGYLYEPFIQNSLIAIGYPEISVQEMAKYIQKGRTDAPDGLRQLVVSSYPQKERPGFIAAQLFKFASVMKKGDYVLAPSTSSQFLYIGIIQSDELNQTKLFKKEKLVTEYFKTRDVKWIKQVSRRSVNPNLFGLFNSHQTIAEANEYAEWIDELLFDFYEKDGMYYLSLDVRHERDLKAKQFFQAIIDLLALTDHICAYIGLDQNTDDVDTKINLNSPGTVKLIGKLAKALFISGAIIVGINGGKSELKVQSLGLSANIGTDGLIFKINEFLNSNADRDLKQSLSAKLDSLKIINPTQIESMLKIINEKNQNELPH